MIRLLVLLSCLAWPVTSSTDLGARDPLTPIHDIAFADAERISPLIEKRFALLAAMERCNLSDDQYAFNVTLDRFAPSERYILQKAAYAGWSEGEARAASEAGSCESAIDRLREADDALLAQAELLPLRVRPSFRLLLNLP